MMMITMMMRRSNMMITMMMRRSNMMILLPMPITTTRLQPDIKQVKKMGISTGRQQQRKSMNSSFGKGSGQPSGLWQH